jgi:hypothetical protein
MGNVQNTSVKQMVDITNSFITNVSNSTSTDSSAITSNRQTFKILTGEKSDVRGCDTSVNQSITTSQQLKTSSKFQTSAEIKNELMNMVDQVASTNQNAVAEFLSLSANVQNSSQELQTSIKNSIENNITNESTVACTAIANNLQEGEITILGKYTCGPSGRIDLTQQLVNDQLAECISNVFNDAIADNTIVNQIVQDSTVDQSAKTIGPIGALFGGIGALIILAVIGGIAYFLITSSGSKKPSGPGGLSLPPLPNKPSPSALSSISKLKIPGK